MSNKESNNELQERSVKYTVNGEEVKLSPNIIRNFLVSGNGEVSDQEVTMFLQLCRYQKLNPFLNEAYLVKFGSQPASLIVSKEAFMKRAESHSKYQGLEAGIIVARKNEMVDIEGAIKLPEDVLIGGWAHIHREDRKHPVKIRISFEEFSKGQATWKNQPMNMIRKVAVVNALREAFPESLGAMYTEDETPPNNDINQVTNVQREIEQNANKQHLDFKPQEEVPQQVIQQEEPEMADVTPVEPNPYEQEQHEEQMSIDSNPDF